MCKTKGVASGVSSTLARSERGLVRGRGEVLSYAVTWDGVRPDRPDVESVSVRRRFGLNRWQVL